MDIRRFTPEDRDRLAGWVAVTNAVRAHDAPWDHAVTESRARGDLTHGWDGEPDVPFLGTLDGVPVAAGGYGISERDNLHLAWLSVEIRPDHRRQGHGTALLRHLEREVTALGRTALGISCWDIPSNPETFGLRHGYERKAVGVQRAQHLAEVDPAEVERLRTTAAAAAADYELLRRPGRSPDSELEALAVLTAAINDAPTDDLEIEDEVFDAARIRAYEDAQLACGYSFYRLVARHRATGELAGQTVVVVDEERPFLAHQHDTSVVRAHRGHRLGALLKSEMLAWLGEEQPQITEITTWNAESNAHMIGVNQALGYRVMGRALDLQQSLSPER